MALTTIVADFCAAFVRAWAIAVSYDAHHVTGTRWSVQNISHICVVVVDAVPLSFSVISSRQVHLVDYEHLFVWCISHDRNMTIPADYFVCLRCHFWRSVVVVFRNFIMSGSLDRSFGLFPWLQDKENHVSCLHRSWVLSHSNKSKELTTWGKQHNML